MKTLKGVSLENLNILRKIQSFRSKHFLHILLNFDNIKFEKGFNIEFEFIENYRKNKFNNFR